MFAYLRHLHHKIKMVGYTRFYKTVRARVVQRQAIQRKVPAQLQNSGKKKVPFLERPHLDEKQLLIIADLCAENTFSVLGSPLQKYQTIPWHTDVRLQQQNFQADCTFDKPPFYKNSAVFPSVEIVLKKDIKVPWELARFQYAPLLAIAYQQTSNAKYLTALQSQITSWIDANPFMHGIHWTNPMEVAIRAVNWIVAYQNLGETIKKEKKFHDRFITSLWEHLLFIENRWEWYDGRTNNHYLANLVGYAYLCWFFQEMPGMKKRWQHCMHELRSELGWHVFDEGTSYEGSTHYHALVTELFVHGFLVAQAFGEEIEERALDKLERMIVFADLTQNSAIGDDDSGTLLYAGLYDLKKLFSFLRKTTNVNKKGKELFYYPAAGISFIKTDQWDVSLRHHAYHERQPSAHFHEDYGSITLSYNGLPIIVDPGTYVYTASAYWRNYFRSIKRHNTFYPESWRSLCTDDLFFLALAQRTNGEADEAMRMTHTLFGYLVSRAIEWTKSCVTVRDDISQATAALRWQFIFSPIIELQQNSFGWDIFSDKKRILRLESPDIIFHKTEAWVSPSYGVKQKTFALEGTQKNKARVTTIRFMA